jgi:N-acetylated-alpha-linked acidic dipeptidase
VYHSVYDNHLWMSKFGDPGFVRHASMARLWGTMALRLANADVLPLDYRATARRIREFVTETIESASGANRAALAPLVPAAARLDTAARRAGNRIDALLAGGPPARPAAAAIDRMLVRTERAFLDPAGLPQRPWYRHLIYAPKATYAPQVLPGVAEALDAGDRALVAREVERLVAALDRAANALTPR